MIYVELWYDAEKDREWKITMWQIEDYDFDPMVAPYITLDLGTQNQHRARDMQLAIVRDLKQESTIVANAYIDRSRYLIRPRWMEELLSPLGRIEYGQANRSVGKDTSEDGRISITDLRQTYTIWLRDQGGTEISCRIETTAG